MLAILDLVSKLLAYRQVSLAGSMVGYRSIHLAQFIHMSRMTRPDGDPNQNPNESQACGKKEGSTPAVHHRKGCDYQRRYRCPKRSSAVGQSESKCSFFLG